MSTAYFAPNEGLIFYCKKNWVLPLWTFLCGILFFLPIGIIPIIARVPLEVALICISSTVIYFTANFLGLRGYRKSYLVLSNRRLFMRYGIFFAKDRIIPLESIESITYVNRYRTSHCLISTTDGRKIQVAYPFRWEELEKLAAHINALKNNTTYLEPKKKKY